MPSEIAVPFRVSGGRVVTASDPDALVRLHMLSLVNTQPDERVMLAGYGVDTHSLVFEDMDSEDRATQASRMIASSVESWEPGIRLDEVAIDPGDDTTVIDVHFSRKDAADSGAVANANEAVIGANGYVQEIVRG